MAYSIAHDISPELTYLIHFLDKRKIFPDKVIYLDVPPEIAFARSSARKSETLEAGGVDKVEVKGLPLQQTVYQEYARRIEENPNYIVIDCNNNSIEEIHNQIKSRII